GIRSDLVTGVQTCALPILARVQAVLRRYAPLAGRFGGLSRDGVIQLGEIEIDSLGMRLSVAGKDIGATTLEFRLIQHLARNQGRDRKSVVWVTRVGCVCQR